MSSRPQNEEELQKREAIGVIRASRFVRKYARSNEKINFEAVCKIHQEIFKDAWPEIAGKYREENLEITDSKHLPPHHSQVLEQIQEAEMELAEVLKKLTTTKGKLLNLRNVTDEMLESVDSIVHTAAWIHHKITYIHPFREGNGRTARLAANLILERYGLVGISIRIEKENKNRYRQALAQIDQNNDYEPLKTLIYEGLIERYNGLEVKYYEYKSLK